MPRGGARPGAGKPLGSKNRKTREIAEKAAAEGLTPIEVMLTIMRLAMQDEQPDHAKALAAAQAAAPYVHPRLSAQTVSIEPAASKMTDEELEAAIAARKGG